MTEEQRKFKIKKKEEYTEQISKENKSAIVTAFATASCAAISYLVLSNIHTYDRENASRFVSAFIGGLDVSLTSCFLKRLIEAVSKKTMLEGKVEDINNELEMAEEEESRAKTRC